MLTDDSLEFARRHIGAFYDTDFFPKPFEFLALWHCWDEVKAYLLATPLKEVLSSQPRVLPWHKARGGYRVVHQLEPIDALIYTALIYQVAEKVERARMGPQVSCAYRIEVSENSFFSRGSGFDTYRENCERLAFQHNFVLSTDISDFYNQIYLHRIRNGLEEIGAGADLAKEIEAFLMRLNTKSSQGLPVGPAASIILAEAALIDVDHFIAHRGLSHVRYVDDFRIFADSEADLKAILEDLVVYMHQQHRLGLVSEKTKIQDSSTFLHVELQNAYQLEKLDLMRGIEAGNQYGEYREDDDYVDDEDSEEDGDHHEAEGISLGDRLSIALERARKSGAIDLGVMRAIIRRAKHARDYSIAPLLCDDLEFYLPVINDVALYFDSLPLLDHLVLAPSLSQACELGQLNSQSAKIWMGWYLARHVFGHTPALRQYVQRCGVSTATSAELARRNPAWSKEAKLKVSSTASWDRRAYILALSGLSPDERNVTLRMLKDNVSLTKLDGWVCKWVQNGAPGL
jgi:hypothetical protein